MKETEFFIPSPVDQLPISCLVVEPEQPPRAVVLMAHGIMEHKERFLPVMRFFAEHGFACAMNDQRGNGKSIKSEEDLGYTYGAGAGGILQDMRALGEEMIRRYPGKKTFLYGHSLGALCAMAYMKRFSRDVNGAILNALPADNKALGVGRTYLKFKKRVKGARFRDEGVRKLMNDNYAARFKGEASPFSWLSSDPDAVRRYEEDPLCGYLGTVENYLAVLDIMDEAYDKKGWDRVSGMCPVFIAVGADDPCAEGEKGAAEGEKFLKSVGLARAEHRSYASMRHEIQNERGAEKPLTDELNRLIAWL
ncbi:MAG: alpha/beta fold hydrolase [Clostridia bacterium]|jgi:alpha-beta hydrolase superfamily lysophospholipase|nr:alpha/beta fold hydrolase [Clostridia bacterium]